MRDTPRQPITSLKTFKEVFPEAALAIINPSKLDPLYDEWAPHPSVINIRGSCTLDYWLKDGTGDTDVFPWFLAVKPSQAVVDAINGEDGMISITYDTIHFQVCVNEDDDEARVYAKHNLIIGDRLIARIAKASIPLARAMPPRPGSYLDKREYTPEQSRHNGYNVTIPTEVESVLRQATCRDDLLTLPGQLDKKLYGRVNDILNLIGGKWNSGRGGHVFKGGAQEALDKALSQGQVENTKKKTQAFMTPKGLAARLANALSPMGGARILEPSAGEGALIKAVQALQPQVYFDAVEIDKERQAMLRDLPAVAIVGEDFMTYIPEVLYDGVIMNPPFTRNQDIKHVSKAYTCLKDGGRLVAVTAEGWIHSTHKAETSFRDWLEYVGAQVDPIPAGTFKESGTSIATCLITINKKKGQIQPPDFGA